MARFVRATLDRSRWALVLLAVLTGCQGQQTTHNDRTRAEHVISRDQTPSLSFIGRLQRLIGTDSGPAPYMFGDISSVVVDSAGTVFVADRMENEVSVFSSTGDFRFHIGRSGSGPGELQAPCCLMLGGGDELWVRD